MPHHPLTYTRTAASCPTPVGRTTEAVGISGGAIFTPPIL